MRVHSRIPRISAAVAVGLLVFGTVQVLGASSAFADGDVSVAAFSVGVGASGTQQISIPDGSGLIGQSTPVVVVPDSALAGTGFSATVDAGDTGGSCSADSGDSGYTCQSPATGWSAGSLSLDFNAGGSSTPVPDCGASCTFTTSVYENAVGGTPVATGTVTSTAEAGLLLELTGFAGGGLTIKVTNSGPTETADMAVSLTGLGGYTVTSSDSRCGAAGSAFVCDAGDTSGAQATSVSWSVTLAGGSGPITLAASAYASVYPGGVVDTLSGSATAQLPWTPVTAPSPPAGGGATGPAGKPTQTAAGPPVVKVTATGEPKAAPGGDKQPAVLVTAKAVKVASASAVATASASGTETGTAAPTVGAQVGALAGPSSPAVAGDTSTGGSGSSGSGTLVLVVICVVALAVLALVAWRLWLAAARRRAEGEGDGDGGDGGGGMPPLAPSAAAVVPRGGSSVRPYGVGPGAGLGSGAGPGSGGRAAVESVVESDPRGVVRPGGGAGAGQGSGVGGRGEQQQTEVLSAYFSRSVVTPGGERDSGGGAGSGEGESARSVLSALSGADEGLGAGRIGDRGGSRRGRGRDESAGESTVELGRADIAAGGGSGAGGRESAGGERSMDDTGPIDLSQFFTRSRSADPRTPVEEPGRDEDDPDSSPRRW